MKTEDFKTESPIEASMLAALLPVIDEHVSLETQRPVATRISRYRVDFCASAVGRSVVIECDGRDFHDFHADRTRDTAMLDVGGVTDVIRFRGSDINFDIDGCMDKIRLFFPFLFYPDRQPRDADDMLFASEQLRGGHVKPIVRTRQVSVSAPAMRHETAQIVGRTADLAFIVELRSPEWSWQYQGPREQTMGDCLAQALDGLIGGQGK